MTRRRFGLGSRVARRRRCSEFLFVLSFARPPRRWRPRRPLGSPRPHGLRPLHPHLRVQSLSLPSRTSHPPVSAPARQLEDA